MKQQQQHRILLVDDEADILHVIKRGLEINGFHVDAYSSPQEVLDSFKPSTYDLAILDIRMPAMTGFQLYREIKRLDPTITACFLSAFKVHPNEFEIIFPYIMEVQAVIKKLVPINQLLREIIPLLRISAITRARRGEHFLVAFETPEELMEQSLQFLKVGLLKNDEDILLVTDEYPKNIIREKITKEWNVDVKSLEANGRITLMTFPKWHLIDGKLDIKRSKTMMTKMVQKALGHERKGFRSVGDMNLFISKGMIRHLVSLESSLEKQFDLPITLLCAYTRHSIKQFDNSIIVALQQHRNRMTTGGGGGRGRIT